MNKYLKLTIIVGFVGCVSFLIALASGYTTYTDCEFYKARRTSLVPILIIVLVSFITGKILKMDKDLVYIFVGAVFFGSFFIVPYLYDKKYEELLLREENKTTKAIIKNINYQQFTTFLKFETVPQKFTATLALKKKSDIRTLKEGDTILIKYAISCAYLIGFHNLSPTKDELKLYD
ncbi:hypothetical protein [Cellulophaga baltica]|uniref:hypothetical protein n=1 Tax=Cellulophaga baltica TaxID=76594 RepID=UPI00249465AA|nr:hypothetical protein [Cellulophaga baltica]